MRMEPVNSTGTCGHNNAITPPLLCALYEPHSWAVVTRGLSHAAQSPACPRARPNPPRRASCRSPVSGLTGHACLWDEAQVRPELLEPQLGDVDAINGDAPPLQLHQPAERDQMGLGELGIFSIAHSLRSSAPSTPAGALRPLCRLTRRRNIKTHSSSKQLSACVSIDRLLPRLQAHT
jgi:hypothetical protein